MPIFDAASDPSAGGANTCGNGSGHVAEVDLPDDAHGFVTVHIFGWCPQSSGALQVCRVYRDLSFVCMDGVATLESRAPDVDSTDSALSGAVTTVSASGGGTTISVDVAGVTGMIIGWEADIQVSYQTPPSF